jgi:hypothetical protein
MASPRTGKIEQYMFFIFPSLPQTPKLNVKKNTQRAPKESGIYSMRRSGERAPKNHEMFSLSLTPTYKVVTYAGA